MNRITKILSASALIVSTCAFAQTTGNVKPADRGTQNAQPGKSGEAMSRAADTGTTQPASGTLMQKRENAMSAEGASGANATGKMKQ
ncbi:hypothetical protein LJ655_10515 [Paraburkholderia sp. MMS20-SJTN17]|uniref:Lipoprotein n=1 Tax=Paraburkholderia translucens TaxID=2886945 RepID=A0ABS8KC26_9BURK|nr:hypothetical protein [Paraburkholderia sp. MMS20-SJTN17]MCC8402320.1 hypothetical protein [Paraburkholderia sp. MMS20-SJTN17]